MSVLITEFNDQYFRDVAQELSSHLTDSIYLVTSALELYQDRSQFPNVTFINEQQFQYSDLIPSPVDITNNSLSTQVIEEYRDLENLYLSITDRLCFYPKTVVTRKQRYYELLLYWLTFFEKHNVTSVIFARVPHLGYGNIVYAIAQKKGLRISILRETLLNDCCLITSDFNNFRHIPATFLAEDTLTQLKKKIGTDKYNQLYRPSQLMSVNLSDNATAMKQNTSSLFKSLTDGKTIKALLSLVHYPWDRVYGTPTYMEPPVTWLGYYQMLIKYYLKNRSLFTFYQKHSLEVDLTQKFIYFPLHYQPERTSMPEGGVFENQLLILDILSKSVPKDWFIYVKEHPYQFLRSDVRKVNFREIDFYQKILKYRNVKLVSLKVNSRDLIAACQSSVTITGSTGWETLIQGKPCLTFSASAWYSPCRSSLAVSSQAECKAALQELSHHTKSVVSKNVLKFLLYYQKKFINTAASFEAASISKQNYSRLVQNCSEAFLKTVN